MPPTTSYSFGELILVPFPFTDQTGSKKRPAVVISSTGYNLTRRDVVIMAVTSQLKASGALGETFVSDWKVAGLLKPSAIKPVITTIEQSLVLRRLGVLAAGDQQNLKDAMAGILG